MSSVDESRSWDFISDAFYPDWLGGLQRYATELAEAAQSRQGTVYLWTRTWQDRGGEFIQAELPGADVHSVGGWLPSSLRGPLLTLASLVGVSLGFRLKGRVRIAHTAVLGNLFFARNSPMIQIYVFHASPSLELQAKAIETGTYSLKRRLHCWMLRHLELSCLSKADKVVVLSEYSRSIVESLSPRSSPKVKIIPGGTQIDEEFQATPPARKPKKLVTVRRLEWRMGIDILLEAFARCDIAHEGWTLQVVGEGSERENLERLAKSLGIGSAVEFTGRVSEEKKAQILKDARFFVLPTRAHEGFGLATVEAMAAGAVPIVTSVGASPEIVGRLDPMLICLPDADSLAETMRHWTRDERSASYSSLCASSREIAVTYGWSSVYAKWKQLISEVTTE